MECSRINENLHPFLFMGCWNTIGPGRDAVFAALAANPIRNLVLAGDNVYPLEADEKMHRITTFEDGLEKLRETKTILLSALGNHNIVENEKVIFKEGNEWDSLEAAQRAAFGMPASGPRYFCKQFNDAAVIVLDTNIAKKAAEMEKMADALKAALDSLGDFPYYIIQHEPFASFKKPGKNHLLPNSNRILEILAAKKPIAVLCADTHNYQEGWIHVGAEKIKQIVVGTGGASPDRYDKRTESLAPLIISDTKYYEISKVISLTNYGYYGFYEMTRAGVGKFVSSNFKWPAAGGSRRKLRRRRRGTRRSHKK